MKPSDYKNAANNTVTVMRNVSQKFPLFPTNGLILSIKDADWDSAYIKDNNLIIYGTSGKRYSISINLLRSSDRDVATYSRKILHRNMISKLSKSIREQQDTVDYMVRYDIKEAEANLKHIKTKISNAESSIRKAKKELKRINELR